MRDWLSRSKDALGRSLAEVWRAVALPPSADGLDGKIAGQARAVAPVVWLVGKVQSGKSSIVRALTGCTAIETGEGFKPCTRTACVFDFPPEAPVIRFLDTRGLAEAGYDPAGDLAVCEGKAQFVLAVMKALDHNQGPVLGVLRAVRTRHPDWPIAVAQTCLHEAYPPGAGHPRPYPFGEPDGTAAGTAAAPAPAVPEALARSLAAQRRLFGGLPGTGPIVFVPLDFTAPGDGFEPANYGFGALADALEKTAPAAVAASLHEAHAGASARRAGRAHPHILGYALAAGAADTLPAAGLAAVPAVQAKMLHSLARLYGIPWDRRLAGEFAAALGVGTAVKALAAFGARELGKFVPVYGQTAGTAAAAAASFATTFALGKAASVFLEHRRRGRLRPGDVTAAYREALASAFRMARERRTGRTRKTSSPARGE